MNMQSTLTVSLSDITSGLDVLGVDAGDHVIVHSSLKSFGRVESGPGTVIDALEETITSAGTVMMPTFSSWVLYFLEGVVTRQNERGIVGFEGTLAELWQEMKAFAEKDRFSRFPFAHPADVWRRLRKEGFLTRYGWTFEPDVPEIPDVTQVRVLKNTPALSRQELKPWMMPVNTGIIPGTFAVRPETRRSAQYSGSFTVWGVLTEMLLERHDNHSPQQFEDHPLHRLLMAGGKILLLGVDHRRNSMIHIIESVVARERGLEPGTKTLDNFMDVDTPLTQNGGQQKTMIGNAEVRYIDAQELLNVVREIREEKMSV